MTEDVQIDGWTIRARGRAALVLAGVVFTATGAGAAVGIAVGLPALVAGGLGGAVGYFAARAVACRWTRKRP
jgi:hypothetical protein